jgi:hypothetical protein
MAVQFTEDKFIITVTTGCNPIENWLETHDELIDLLQARPVDEGDTRCYYWTLELLRSMMPDLKTAKMMNEIKSK